MTLVIETNWFSIIRTVLPHYISERMKMITSTLAVFWQLKINKSIFERRESKHNIWINDAIEIQQKTYIHPILFFNSMDNNYELTQQEAHFRWFVAQKNQCEGIQSFWNKWHLRSLLAKENTRSIRISLAEVSRKKKTINNVGQQKKISFPRGSELLF